MQRSLWKQNSVQSPFVDKFWLSGYQLNLLGCCFVTIMLMTDFTIVLEQKWKVDH